MIKMVSSTQRVLVVDSHTGGEPTRLVLEGGPDLGCGSLAQRRERFRLEHDAFRNAVINEPRGSDVIVGALLVEPVERFCTAGVIFFNNVGYLGMCGHGTIGVIASLAHLGRIDPGQHYIETPVGVVSTWLHKNGEVSFDNVPSYRQHKAVTIEVPGYGVVKGDIAWGGNWFFLTEAGELSLSLANLELIEHYASALRQAVNEQGYPEVDHIELFGPPTVKGADSRNFVMCPGGAYDRSPCGTGTSAKLACLAADGKLAEGQTWTQESIIGSIFRGSYQRQGEQIIPRIAGRAHISAESTLILDAKDPFCWGITQ